MCIKNCNTCTEWNDKGVCRYPNRIWVALDTRECPMWGDGNRRWLSVGCRVTFSEACLEDKPWLKGMSGIVVKHDVDPDVGEGWKCWWVEWPGRKELHSDYELNVVSN